MKSISLGLLLFFRVVCSAQEQFPQVDAIINDAVQTNLIPGAVLVVGHNGQIAYQKAYGSRSLIPARESMTLDTIFDAASLTKVVATTPSIMKLFEQGKIRLDDPVTKYLPEFQGGQSEITIRLLMTLFSGFAPDFDMGSPWNGYATGLQKALAEKPIAPPGSTGVAGPITAPCHGWRWLENIRQGARPRNCKPDEKRPRRAPTRKSNIWNLPAAEPTAATWGQPPGMRCRMTKKLRSAPLI